MIDGQGGNPSAAALNFIRETSPDACIAPTRSNVLQLRQESRAYFEPRGKRAVERHGARVAERVIAGVPCLDVTTSDMQPGLTILYFYGGGYVVGSAREDLTIAAPLAALCRARVIAPQYRLAPEHFWPAAPDDGIAVYERLAGEGNAVAIAAESAGGNLALVTMLRAKDRGLPLPVSAALLSPWCDLENQGDSLITNDRRDPTVTTEFVANCTSLYAPGRDLRQPEISPVYGAYTSEFPPTLITTGTRDLLLSHCTRLATVLRESGVMVTLQVWEDLWHVFEIYDELPEASRSLKQIAAHLGGYKRLG